MQSQISSAKFHCELAAKQPFFETLQSCVSSAVTLSHRFKSSPAIPGKVEIPGAAGYLMNAGHFRQNFVSSGDLNRGRRTESRVLFMVLFARRKKYQSVSLTGKLRGFANLDSAHPNKNFPLTKLKPFSKKDSRFCKPRISAQNYNFAQTK